MSVLPRRGTSQQLLQMARVDIGWQADLLEAVQEELERLRDEVNETIYLARHEDGYLLYLDQLGPSHAVRLLSAVGLRCPLHMTAMGRPCPPPCHRSR